MWRPAHGATTRPGPCRPESGYGRALGRPGPRSDGPLRLDDAAALDPTTFVALVEVLDPVEPAAPVPRDAERAAPVTP
jgi:hypothetical protein